MAGDAGALERVDAWHDVLRSRCTVARKKEALAELLAATAAPAYAEEARIDGLIGTLTRLLSTSEDEELMDLVSQIISACSGPLACSGKASQFTYGCVTVAIREGTLGDGLGARVWTVAHLLCAELAAHPQLVAGAQVLEIGSGCGIVGIVASQLGALQVVLTDVEEAVLDNLRACVALNAGGASGCAPAAAGGDAGVIGRLAVHAVAVAMLPGDAEAFDDAQSVEGMEVAGLAAPPGPGDAAAGGWDAANMAVRRLDWNESLRLGAADSMAKLPLSGGGDAAAASAEHALLAADAAPLVPLWQQFDVVIGNEVLYEPLHASLVPAVVAHRLRPGGLCLLCCAVRYTSLFAAFAAQCAARGLRYRAVPVQPPAGASQHGILGRESDYEGGFLLMAMDHAGAPSGRWHRHDFAAAPLFGDS